MGGWLRIPVAVLTKARQTAASNVSGRASGGSPKERAYGRFLATVLRR